MAKCADNPSPEGTAPQGSYQPNGWGLHNMIGNAFELTEDCASENYHGAPADGSPGWRAGRAQCGKFRHTELFLRQHSNGFALGCAVYRAVGNGKTAATDLRFASPYRSTTRLSIQKK